jgi:hypothetical protein
VATSRTAVLLIDCGGVKRTFLVSETGDLDIWQTRRRKRREKEQRKRRNEEKEIKCVERKKKRDCRTK